MTARMPTWFLAHGAPTHLLGDHPVRDFWQCLPDHLPQPPRAIVCLSAHWLTDAPCLAGQVATPQIQYDFHGFPEALHHVRWPLKGDPDTAQWLRAWLRDAIPDLEEAPDRPFDHGVWVPLVAAWPVPPFAIYQLSLCPRRGTQWHLELGQRLAALRDQGVLLIGSGGLVHNLSRIDWCSRRGKAVSWADAFMQAWKHALARQDANTLCQPWSLPHGRDCVPTIEHYLPCLIALGAGEGDPVRPLHEGWEYGSLALHSYAFGSAGAG